MLKGLYYTYLWRVTFQEQAVSPTSCIKKGYISTQTHRHRHRFCGTVRWTDYSLRDLDIRKHKWFLLSGGSFPMAVHCWAGFPLVCLGLIKDSLVFTLYTGDIFLVPLKTSKRWSLLDLFLYGVWLELQWNCGWHLQWASLFPSMAVSINSVSFITGFASMKNLSYFGHQSPWNTGKHNPEMLRKCTYL